MTLAKAVNFKYTFPIAKAEQRSDGSYLVGYASGPEVDIEGERMAPEAIERFAGQITAAQDAGSPLVYRDAHAPDGVLRDLGDITKAWINEHFHLGIEIKVNMDNPAGAFLFRSVLAGKQYGMSVAGRVLDFADEMDKSAGKIVRTYKNVVLDEISNTTRPAWYPSFGSVLAKSVKDTAAADLALGEEVGDKITLPAGDDTAKSDDTTVVDDTTTESADDAAKAAATATDDNTEKAGRKVSGATATKLIGLFNEMQTALTDLGVIETPSTTDDAEKSDAKTAENSTEKSESAPVDELAAIKTELGTLKAANEAQATRIAELESAPRTSLPPAVTEKDAAQDEFMALLAKATPSERLRLVMAARTGGK